MTQARKIREFIRNEEATTIIEFALVAPIFFMLMFTMIEFGMIRFSQVAIEAALSQASRTASIGASTGGCDRVCTVQRAVQRRTMGLINASAISVASVVVGQGSTVAPDICLTVTPYASPAVCPPDPATGQMRFQDTNGNNTYEGAGNMSLGNSGELVEMRVSYPWRVQIPFGRSLFGENGVFMISSSILLRNE
jgi:Flp pilus assembly protein TadG